MGKKSELDELRARLATLEAEVDRLRGEAAASGAASAVAAGQPQAMTRIADAVGVMVSGRAERTEEPTKVLRTEHTEHTERTERTELTERTEAPETLIVPLPQHGEFLEGLLSGRPALQQ
ncbi:hypothetical protein [Streptomyces sp. CBMA123]|uniref:hypothetical protein n=1 Tax=Streptomyces sp. CBMA123 TaxID=1896313 RepID=UPI001661E465|nr:hypothetical protein [Streptomyces sp. CBMA123]MBD0689140.1 hypothetical protein [Streptomyces sp. CBMA123]